MASPVIKHPGTWDWTASELFDVPVLLGEGESIAGHIRQHIQLEKHEAEGHTEGLGKAQMSTLT